MGFRVRWELVAKGAAVVVAGLVALQLVPALLKPPAPEPLPADVGLSRVAASPLELPERRPQRPLGRVVSGGGVSRRAEPSEGEAHPAEGSRPSARRRSQPKRGTPTRRQDPPAEAPAPDAPPTEPAPEPPPPAPPDDGSMEFAPH